MLILLHIQIDKIEKCFLLQDLTPAQISAAKQKFNYYDKVQYKTYLTVFDSG